MPYLREHRRGHRRRCVGSGTVGPEAITDGSSPGTSEISSATTRAGGAAAASRPPLIAERCLRTQFISSIVAPERSSARFTACLSARVRPGRQRQQRRAAAGDQAEHQVVGTEALHQLEDARGRRAPGLVGHRMRRLDDLDAPGRHAMAVAGDDQAFEQRPCQASSTARAIAAAALPAPTTMVRPRGGGGSAATSRSLA